MLLNLNTQYTTWRLKPSNAIQIRGEVLLASIQLVPDWGSAVHMLFICYRSTKVVWLSDAHRRPPPVAPHSSLRVASYL